MSSEDRLARLGLAHLANSPNELAAALQKKLEEQEAIEDEYERQRQRDCLPWALQCFKAHRDSELEESFLPSVASSALTEQLGESSALQERWERLLTRFNGLLDWFPISTRRFASPTMHRCATCNGAGNYFTAYGPMPCRCWKGNVPEFSWDTATEQPASLELVDGIGSDPKLALVVEELAREHLFLLGGFGSSQRVLWRSYGLPSNNDGFRHVRECSVGAALTETWELIATYRIAPLQLVMDDARKYWRDRSLTTRLLEGAWNEALAQKRTLHEGPLGPNPFTPLRELQQEGFALDGIVDGVPLLVAPEVHP